MDLAVLVVCQRAVLLSGSPAVMSHWCVLLDSAEEDGGLYRFVRLLTSTAIESKDNNRASYAAP